MNGCLIEEAEGRCEEYLRGECDECLCWTAQWDWVGWKKIKEVDKDGSSVE